MPQDTAAKLDRLAVLRRAMGDDLDVHFSIVQAHSLLFFLRRALLRRLPCPCRLCWLTANEARRGTGFPFAGKQIESFLGGDASRILALRQGGVRLAVRHVRPEAAREDLYRAGCAL